VSAGPRAVAAAVFLAVAASLFALKISSKMPDFEVYRRAGARALAGQPLYRTEDEHYQLKYLPAFAILAIPSALLPQPVAKGLWFTGSVALIGVVLAWSLALLPSRRKAASVLTGATLLVMAKFYGHELVLGQVNLLLTALVLAAVLLLPRAHPVAAGLLLALAVIVKPYAVIFFPWLAALRAWPALASASMGVTAALVLPALVYGFSGTVSLHQDWWRTVTTSTAPNLLNPDNVSVAAMYAKWIGMGAPAARLAALTGAALLVAAAIAFLRRGRVPSPAGLEAALLLTMIPLLSPQGWDYVFLLSTPAVMYLVNYDAELPAPARALTWLTLAIIGLSVYDLLGRRAYGAFMAVSAISVCYLVIIAILLTLRLRRVA
jgi:hypothetical protein